MARQAIAVAARATTRATTATATAVRGSNLRRSGSAGEGRWGEF
ncbi:hypothetical protein L083_4448 [Actinoplanes sp. N902-109]|nr:hypothetical protein L083_4448 [Actinoplanes sp. N902-109]